MWRITIIVFLVLLISISATVTIGQHQVESKHLEILHLNDCDPPCWAEIQPGITTVAEAKMLIEKWHHLTADVEIKFSNKLNPLSRFGLDSNSPLLAEIDLQSTSEQDTTLITEISFNFASSQTRHITLGDLELAYPPPTYIRFIEKEPPDPPYLIALEYEKQGVFTGEAIIITRNPLRPTDAVLQLRFFASTPLPCKFICKPWRGYTTLENYYPSQP